MTDYGFYFNKYRGNKIDEMDFPRYADRAADILFRLKRDYTISGSKRMWDKTICAIAEAVQATELAASAAFTAMTDGVLASVSTGSVSESYRYTAPKDTELDLSEAATMRRYYDIARRYLTIYRGVRR